MAQFRLSKKIFLALDAEMRAQATAQGTKQFASQSRDIAQAVIVDGIPAAEVAKTWSVSKQRVSQLVTRYYAGLMSSPHVEKAVVLWVTRGVELPSTLIEPLEQFLLSLRSQKETDIVQSAVDALVKTLRTQTKKLE